MSEALLEKIIAIHNLKLPRELCDHINSFSFYDEYQANLKNLKISSHEKIKYSFHGQAIMGKWGQWWFEASRSNTLPERQFQACYCRDCGNYVRSNNIHVIATRSICSCGVDQNLHHIYQSRL